MSRRSSAKPIRPANVPSPLTVTLQFAGSTAPLIDVDEQALLPLRSDPLASASAPNTQEPTWYMAPIWPPASHPLASTLNCAGVSVSPKKGKGVPVSVLWLQPAAMGTEVEAGPGEDHHRRGWRIHNGRGTIQETGTPFPFFGDTLTP